VLYATAVASLLVDLPPSQLVVLDWGIDVSADLPEDWLALKVLSA
jgi:hypothetical protein